MDTTQTYTIDTAQMFLVVRGEYADKETVGVSLTEQGAKDWAQAVNQEPHSADMQAYVEPVRVLQPMVSRVAS
jgi:hypothetical protein